MAWEKAKQTFRIQGRRRAAASSVASLGYRPHTEKSRQELNPLVPELFIKDRVSQPLSPFQLLTDIDYVDLPATEDRDPDWRPSGTSILILEDNLPQTCCLIGVISQLFPGRDRVVRAAQILTSKGEVTRLVAKLVVLVPASVANGEEDSSSRGKIVDDKTRSPERQ
ncbi:hypothetical protein D917_10443 [Trichinella nativa]|uniref:DUF5641 domain-containing protein n=1 Tax=Trichinella nativa TaxID=6335 RepID=A0A1Y3EAF7_9BILA|nr:hypothetical protein D917_10443 [Trichinella nativa]